MDNHKNNEYHAIHAKEGYNGQMAGSGTGSSGKKGSGSSGKKGSGSSGKKSFKGMLAGLNGSGSSHGSSSGSGKSFEGTFGLPVSA